MSNLVSWANLAGDPAEDPEADRDLVGKIAVMSDWLTAAAMCLGRAQRIQTIASSQAKVASRWADAEIRRQGRVQFAAGISGLAGLLVGAATLLPRFIPHEFLAPATACSFVCLALPVVFGLWSITRDGRRPETRLAVLAGRAQSMAMLSDRLTKVVEKLRGRDGLEPAHQQCLDLLLLDVEREIEEVGHAMRSDERAGRTLRRDARIVPLHRKVVVRAEDGRRLFGTIADLSISGVALTECLPHLEVGHDVTIGSRPAKVARVWDKGIAFTFKAPLDVSTFDENIVL